MEFLKGADGTEVAFWCFAIFGTAFFILRVLMMVIGGFGAEDLDHSGADADAAGSLAGDVHDGAHAHHSDRLTASDTAFKLFSIHSITAFFMMLGWVGLACYKQFGLSVAVSGVSALVAGLFTMYVTGMLYKVMLGLAAPGATFRIEELVGQDVTVYLKIPAGGVGKVQFSDKGLSRIIEAVSDEKVAIDSFTTVRVVRTVSPRRVAVEPASPEGASGKS